MDRLTSQGIEFFQPRNVSHFFYRGIWNGKTLQIFKVLISTFWNWVYLTVRKTQVTQWWEAWSYITSNQQLKN